MTASTDRCLSICIGLRRSRSEFDIVIPLALLPDAMAGLRPKIAWPDLASSRETGSVAA